MGRIKFEDMASALERIGCIPDAREDFPARTSSSRRSCGLVSCDAALCHKLAERAYCSVDRQVREYRRAPMCSGHSSSRISSSAHARSTSRVAARECDATQAERRKIVEPAGCLEPVRAIGQVSTSSTYRPADARAASWRAQRLRRSVDLEDTLPSAPRRIHVGAPLVKSSEALRAARRSSPSQHKAIPSSPCTRAISSPTCSDSRSSTRHRCAELPSTAQASR